MRGSFRTWAVGGCAPTAPSSHREFLVSAPQPNQQTLRTAPNLLTLERRFREHPAIPHRLLSTLEPKNAAGQYQRFRRHRRDFATKHAFVYKPNVKNQTITQITIDIDRHLSLVEHHHLEVLARANFEPSIILGTTRGYQLTWYLSNPGWADCNHPKYRRYNQAFVQACKAAHRLLATLFAADPFHHLYSPIRNPFHHLHRNRTDGIPAIVLGQTESVEVFALEAFLQTIVTADQHAAYNAYRAQVFKTSPDKHRYGYRSGTERRQDKAQKRYQAFKALWTTLDPSLSTIERLRSIQTHPTLQTNERRRLGGHTSIRTLRRYHATYRGERGRAILQQKSTPLPSISTPRRDTPCNSSSSCIVSPVQYPNSLPSTPRSPYTNVDLTVRNPGLAAALERSPLSNPRPNPRPNPQPIRRTPC